MLGTRIADPEGVEGPPGEVDGLGLLDVETVLTKDKRLQDVQGVTCDDNVAFAGYEMHMGRTTGDCAAFARCTDGRSDGAISPDGMVCGTYIHGLFGADAQRQAWLLRLGAAVSSVSYAASVETALDCWAEHLEAHLRMDDILALAR
jgi:adenosylcobyric acid synthase